MNLVRINCHYYEQDIHFHLVNVDMQCSLAVDLRIVWGITLATRLGQPQLSEERAIRVDERRQADIRKVRDTGD